MALFGTKKNTKTAAPKAEKTVKAPAVVNTTGRDLTHVLKHVRITEKASMHSASGVYVFDISENATKRDIMQAVKAVYAVTPRKVAVVRVPSKTKRNMRTGRMGTKQGGRKAYVYLKAGESITLA